MTDFYGICARGGLFLALLVLVMSGLVFVEAGNERKSNVSTTVNQLELEFKVLRPTITAAGELVCVVVFTNKSASNMRLNGIFLNRPRVLLKVRRRDGLPIHPGPPGMPPLDDGEVGRRVLKPEESVTFQYSGSDYFGTDLSPGKYQVQFRYENILSKKGDWTGKIETEWLDFEVTKPSIQRK